ncbi:MAG: DUF503 domain-containing protein [Aquificota bacterium]|nr:DUF503 domain-containing protein [Aquificota bacterium]
MVVGVLKVEVFLPDADSLKAKRREIRSMKDRIRSRFNVSVSEVDNQELWQRGTIGIAVAGGDVGFVRETLESIRTFVERNWPHLILGISGEIIKV